MLIWYLWRIYSDLHVIRFFPKHNQKSKYQSVLRAKKPKSAFGLPSHAISIFSTGYHINSYFIIVQFYHYFENIYRLHTWYTSLLFHLKRGLPDFSSLCGNCGKVKSLSGTFATIFARSNVWHFWSDSFIASTSIPKVLYGRWLSNFKRFWLRDDWSVHILMSSLSSSKIMHFEIR